MQPNSLQLKAALTYAARGWHIFPTHYVREDGSCSCGVTHDKPGKHPRTFSGLKEATTDKAQIKAWWAEPGNVAIRTGAVSGLIVLDVDGWKGADALAELEARYGRLPNTVEAVTGSGGRHIYFKHPGGVVPNTSRTIGKDVLGYGPQLDSRGDGGYVLAPPSNHASGSDYRWEQHGHPGRVALAEAPEWLVRLMVGRKVEGGAEGDYGAGLELPEQINDGEGREQYLIRLAGKLRRTGLGEDEIYDALAAFNQQRINPPKPDKDLRRIAKSVMRYEADPDEVWRERQRQRQADQRKDEPEEPAAELPDGGFDAWLERGDEWAARGEDDTPAIVPGILHSRAFAMLVAQPKAGKTWIAYDLVLSVISGKPFADRYPVKSTGRVLYVATEGVHKDSAGRLQSMALGKGLVPAEALKGLDIYWRKPIMFDDPDFVRWLADRADQYVLVVVDVLADAWTGDENKNAEVASFKRRLAPVMATGPTILFVHHNTKPNADNAGRDPFLLIRGAGAWYGSLDDGIALTHNSKENNSSAYMKTRAGLPAEPFTFALPAIELDGTQAWTLKGEPKQADALEQSQDLQQAVLETIRYSNARLSSTDLERKVEGRAEAIRSAIRALDGAGLIERTDFTYETESGKRRIKPVWRVANPVPTNGTGRDGADGVAD